MGKPEGLAAPHTRICIAFKGSRESFDIASDKTVLAIKQMVKVFIIVLLHHILCVSNVDV